MNFVNDLENHFKPLKFMRGPRALLKGVSWLFKHPRYLFLGALPAIISACLLATGLVFLIIFSGNIAEFIAPFASNFDSGISRIIKIALQSAIIAGGIVLAYTLFTAVALAIGDPIYSKISETVTSERGGEIKHASWSESTKGAAILAIKGIGVAIFAFLFGLLPVVGGFMGVVITWWLVPLFLAEELLGRTLDARGATYAEKKRHLKLDRKVVWSFGATSQLLFSIPLFPVVIMPAAVAGASILVDELISHDNTAVQTELPLN